MKRAKSLSEAVYRLRALVAVLDEDLRTFRPPTLLPVFLPELDASGESAARSAVLMLEHSLDGLERDLADVRQRARDWTSRATMARGEGREDLALQALWRAAESVREAQEYEEEATAAREFLGQWDARCAAKGK